MFLEILHWYFKEKLEELSAIMDEDGIEEQENECMDLDEKLRYKSGEMDVDEDLQGKKFGNGKLVKNIGKVVHDLRSIGFTSMAENAYASAIFLLLKVYLSIRDGISLMEIMHSCIACTYFSDALKGASNCRVTLDVYVYIPTYLICTWYIFNLSSLLNSRRKCMIWLVMITGLLFWSQ